MNKITTIIATNRKVVARKAVVMGGVILGIGIGLLLNKVEDDDMVIYNEEHDTNDKQDEESAVIEGTISE